jgi:hypothetical protein
LINRLILESLFFDHQYPEIAIGLFRQSFELAEKQWSRKPAGE